MTEREQIEFGYDLSFDDLIRQVAADEESRDSYLRARWIAETITMLRQSRLDRQLTQADIAAKMGTKQPAVARLEASEDISLGRVWDYLRACDLLPTSIDTVDMASGLASIKLNPGGKLTYGDVLSHNYRMKFRIEDWLVETSNRWRTNWLLEEPGPLQRTTNQPKAEPEKPVHRYRRFTDSNEVEQSPVETFDDHPMKVA